jgi:glycerophosphoryl diester phosphodiesterase
LTIGEVFDLLERRLKDGLLLNIELKTSVVRYKGIELKIVEEVGRRGLDDAIVYSSFLSDSIKLIKEINPRSKTGMLAYKLSGCVKWAAINHADALHPFAGGMDLPHIAAKSGIIRAGTANRCIQTRPRCFLWIWRLGSAGVTDIFTNEPERY